MKNDSLRVSMGQKLAHGHYIILISPDDDEQFSAAVGSSSSTTIGSWQKYDTIFYYHHSPIVAIDLAVKAHWEMVNKTNQTENEKQS